MYACMYMYMYCCGAAFHNFIQCTIYIVCLQVIPLVKSLPGPTPQKRSKTSNLPLPTPSTLRVTRSRVLPPPTPSTLTRPAMPTYSAEEDCSSSTDVGPAQCLDCKVTHSICRCVCTVHPGSLKLPTVYSINF